MKRKIYFKFFKYQELLNLKWPLKIDGKMWKIKRVDINEEMRQLFVTVEIHKPKMGNTIKKFIIGRAQQLKLDDLGNKIEIVKYSILQEAFRKKVHSIGSDIDIIFRRKYPSVFKIEENKIEEIGLNKSNYHLLFNSILLAKNEDDFEFYTTNNKIANIGHVKAISNLNLMDCFISTASEVKRYVQR